MKKLFIASAIVATLAGCAAKPVNVTPSPISGSKADGTVVMGYNHHFNPSKPTYAVADWNAAKKLADKKCQRWGYESSERFGDFQNSECRRFGKDLWTGLPTCVSATVSVTYQCID